MQLKKKDEFKPQYENKPQEYKQAPPVDWSIYKIDLDAIVPFGKYAGKRAEYIWSEDEHYWDWMKANNIFGSWGLVKLRNSAPKSNNKEYFPFVATGGEVWLCIYEVEIKKSKNND